jgi:hypothetical protein
MTATRSAPNASPHCGDYLPGSPSPDWTDAIDMTGAQVAVADTGDRGREEPAHGPLVRQYVADEVSVGNSSARPELTSFRK